MALSLETKHFLNATVTDSLPLDHEPLTSLLVAIPLVSSVHCGSKLATVFAHTLTPRLTAHDLNMINYDNF